jgi:hypothetical protein
LLKQPDKQKTARTRWLRSPDFRRTLFYIVKRKGDIESCGFSLDCSPVAAFASFCCTSIMNWADALIVDHGAVSRCTKAKGKFTIRRQPT